MVERTTVLRKSVDTVSVACKLPNGLILQLYDMVDTDEMTPQGPRTIKVARKRGKPVVLKGCALPYGEAPQNPMPGGYAITSVPREFWEQWLKANAESDVIVNRLVFSEGDRESTAQRAKEQTRERSEEAPQGVKSGLEPIDPKNPPKMGALKVTPYRADDKNE